MNQPDMLNRSPASHGGIDGVVVGIVMSMRDNTEETRRRRALGQVKVSFPTLSNEGIGHWARIAVPMAGDQRGMYFLPEEHDEVLVAFACGDITCPFVIGALWNGKDAPPAANDDGKNNVRLIKSRSGHLVRFDDSQGAEKIEIVDKSGKNSITFDSANNSITIRSDKDITIEAPQGTIKLSAKNVDIASSSETKIQSQHGLTADCELGSTTIKGKTVNIN